MCQFESEFHFHFSFAWFLVFSPWKYITVKMKEETDAVSVVTDKSLSY